MSSRLSHFLGLKSPTSPRITEKRDEEDWYIPYKAPEDPGPSNSSWGTHSKTQSYDLGGVGQSPGPVYSAAPVQPPQRTTLSTIFSGFSGTRTHAPARPGPISRSSSLKPSSIARSNSLMSQTSSRSRQELRHRQSHSSDFSANKASWNTDSMYSSGSRDGRQPLNPEPSGKPQPPPTPVDTPVRPEFFHVNSADLLRNSTLRNGTNSSKAHDRPQETRPHTDLSDQASSAHPYANVYSIREEFAAPRTAPLPPLNMSMAGPAYSRQRIPLPANSSLNPSATPLDSHGRLNLSTRALKSSVSVPNLHSARSLKRKPSKLTDNDTTSGKWLSAQSWCDSFLFPRPRLKGRAISISPPESPEDGLPVAWSSGQQSSGHQKEVYQSRVLAHSRSMVNMREEPKLVPVMFPTPSMPGPSALSPLPRDLRPRSFAQDDLALPSPAPSLNTYART